MEKIQMEFVIIAKKINESNNGVQKFQYQIENHIRIAISKSFQAISNWKIEQTKKIAKDILGTIDYEKSELLKLTEFIIEIANKKRVEG